MDDFKIISGKITSIVIEILKRAGAPQEYLDHLQKHLDYESEDPAKYPVAEEVKDSDLLMMFSEVDRRFEKLDKERKLFEMSVKEVELLRERAFMKAEELYPHVRNAEGDSVGYRTYEGRVYYVSFPSCDGRSESSFLGKSEDEPS